MVIILFDFGMWTISVWNIFMDFLYLFSIRRFFCNLLSNFRFADGLNAKDLKSEAEKYIQLNFVRVSKEDEILQLNEDVLMKFISSEYLRIDSEQQVLEFSLRWINHDVSNRRNFIFEILSHIRLSLIPLGKFA